MEKKALEKKNPKWSCHNAGGGTNGLAVIARAEERDGHRPRRQVPPRMRVVVTTDVAWSQTAMGRTRSKGWARQARAGDERLEEWQWAPASGVLANMSSPRSIPNSSSYLIPSIQTCL